VGFLVNTDHQLLILEMNTTLLFGNNLESLPTTLGRGVRTKDRAAVTLFIEAMHDHLHSHNAFTRAHALDNTITRSTAANERLAKQLDRLIGEAGNLGDKSCRHQRPQWYSIQLVRLRLEISALQYYYNGLMCGKDRTLATKRKLNILQKAPDTPLPTDPPTVVRTDPEPPPQSSERFLKLRRALLFTSVNSSKIVSSQLIASKIANFDQEKAKSAPARQQMLSTRADTLDQQHDNAKASVVKSIKHHESSAAIWRTLAHMSAKSTQQTLNKLDIPASWPNADHDPSNTELLLQLEDPKTTTAWRTVTDPTEIEHYLLLRNCLHFGQAQGTPFTVEPLRTHLDWTASLPAADKILLGSHIPSPELSSL
jgi:hypothetical protein